MAVYVELQEDQLDGHQQPKHHILSSFWQKILDILATKKYCILLTIVLLINTVMIIVIANNRISNKLNEGNLYEYESSDLSYEQPLLDYSSDISDDSITENISHMNDEQHYYAPSESANKAAMIPEETNEAQADY